MKPDQSALGPDIQTAVTRGKKGQGVIVSDSFHGGFVEHRESDSVEADEAFLRGSPQVALGSLRDCVNGALRKRLIDSPAGVDILGKSLVGLQRKRASRQKRQDHPKSNPPYRQFHKSEDSNLTPKSRALLR